MQGLVPLGAQLPSPQHHGRIVPTAMRVFGKTKGSFDASLCSSVSILRVSGSCELLRMLELVGA